MYTGTNKVIIVSKIFEGGKLPWGGGGDFPPLCIKPCMIDKRLWEYHCIVIRLAGQVHERLDYRLQVKEIHISE